MGRSAESLLESGALSSVSFIGSFHCKYLLYGVGAFPSNVQFDQEMLSLEDSLTKAFDAVIRLQVDPVWNQLVRRQVEMGPGTDLAVSDRLMGSIPILGV